MAPGRPGLHAADPAVRRESIAVDRRVVPRAQLDREVTAAVASCTRLRSSGAVGFSRGREACAYACRPKRVRVEISPAPRVTPIASHLLSRRTEVAGAARR